MAPRRCQIATGSYRYHLFFHHYYYYYYYYWAVSTLAVSTLAAKFNCGSTQQLVGMSLVSMDLCREAMANGNGIVLNNQINRCIAIGTDEKIPAISRCPNFSNRQKCRVVDVNSTDLLGQVS